MRNFECFFRDPDKPWEFYQRFHDGNESKFQKIFDKQYTFIEDSDGDYTYFLDDSIKLKKVPDYKDLNCKKYGTTNIGYAKIRDEYWDFDKSRYNKTPRIGYLDIETTAKNPINVERCDEQIVLIQLFDKQTNTNIVLGLEDFRPEIGNNKYKFRDETFDFNVKYIKCENEIVLLKTFFTILKNLKFLIIYAHNGNNFDYHYLYKRPIKLGLTPDFSPFGFKSELKQNQNGWSLNVPGCIYLDFIDLYKKFVLKPRESYSLDFLAKTDLKFGKVQHDCFKTFEGFRTGEGYIIPDKEPENKFEKELYHKQNTPEFFEAVKDWFIHYGIVDTYLLSRIDEKYKLSDTLVMIASMTGVNIDDALGSTKQWAQLIFNSIYKDKLISNDLEIFDGNVSVKGGYVRNPRLSKINWGFSLDVNSMYPLLGMYSFNMSPETFVPDHKLPADLLEFKSKYLYDEDEERFLNLYKNNPEVIKELSELLKKYNLAGSLNGAFFRKDKKGIVPKLIDTISTLRKQTKNEMLRYSAEAEKIKDSNPDVYNDLTYKAQMLNVVQNALKVLMNSGYGCLSSKYFAMFNQEIARAITGNGRVFIQLSSMTIEKYLQSLLKNENGYLVYNDTDSIVGSTKIQTSIGEIEIEKFYDLVDSKEIERHNNNFVKSVKDIKALSVNKEFKLENNNILYIMKHKVKKRMFKIKIKDKGIIITEDHSLMVKRNKELISIKPRDVKEGDKILYVE